MKDISFEPDEHMRWIYDPSHPDYNSERASHLRAARSRAIMSAPIWMKGLARFNDAMKKAQDKR